MPLPLRTIHLRAASFRPPSAIAVAEDGGVDLAQVGQALGLDPATVRLNGYFLSHGPGHVSAVTWRALLAFFAARGLPTGATLAAPLAVHGKPAPLAPGSGSLLCSKRKSGLEEQSDAKKSKLTESRSSLLQPGEEELLSDDITLGMKRRLRLEDTKSDKKMKQVEYSSESVNTAPTQQLVKFSCSFINGHGKRPPEDEMVASLSCKRVR